MFFDSWTELLRVAILSALAYAALVGMVRVAGKRALAKMNGFDLVVTVALGSTLSATLLDRTVALAEGLLALAVLLALQAAVTWGSTRSHALRRVVKNEPALLAHRGELLRDAMHRERVTEEEVLQAVRATGVAAVDEIEAVVLETDGSFSVLKGGGDRPATSLRNVTRPDGPERPPPTQ